MNQIRLIYPDVTSADEARKTVGERKDDKTKKGAHPCAKLILVPPWLTSVFFEHPNAKGYQPGRQYENKPPWLDYL
ncbi:MAG TPA: hypothetical protein DDY14_17830 [Chromatiaceae bacterium]|nr:MAG: hypothetical protein N838_10410 [Thiohalocapsa sp. PB-PSB1]HBG97139.1 hypothetical protein [Chromatiaceae bacterium]HCS88498.1 hypothetical protein [Chromatiaceae bacterium]